MDYQVSLSIVLYKTNKEMLQKVINCYNKIGLSKILFLVDNSPTDELKSFASSEENIEYICNGKNIGYGAAHNIALRHALDLSEFHIVLNPDIVFKGLVVEEMYQFAKNNDAIGMLSPKVIDPDGFTQRLCKLLPTPYNLFSRKFLPKSFTRLSQSLFTLRHVNMDHPVEVPFLSGCFMFVRTEIFKTIDMFDERLFLYCEDIDFSRRINKFYETIYYPYVTIIHEHQKESYKSFRMMKIHIKSAIYYFNKWGWLFDLERTITNKKTIKAIKHQNSIQRKIDKLKASDSHINVYSNSIVAVRNHDIDIDSQARG